VATSATGNPPSAIGEKLRLAIGMHILFKRTLAGLIALAAAQAQAQEAPAAPTAQPGEVFVETIDVNLVNVDVFVTDKQGNRVTGLTVDDFELLEDGRPVQITNFYAVEAGRPRAPVPETAPAEEPGSPPEAAELPPVPEAQRLHLIIYLDNFFLKPFSRNRVIAQVRRFLHDRVGTGDRVMLVTAQQKMQVRHPFTTELGPILSELDAIEVESGFAVQAESARRQVIGRIQESQSRNEALSQVDFYAKALRDDVLRTIRNLKELTGSLAGLEGRKAILYVSDLLPMTPGEDLYYLIDQQFSTDGGAAGLLRSRRYSARRDYRMLTARANASRVTFYTLEAAGLRSHSSLSAAYGGSSGGPLAGSSLVDADYARFADGQASLLAMAHDTGGLAAINTNNLEGAFARMSEDFETYYSLGYSSTRSDGRYHQIEVKIPGRRYEIRHRSGYRDRSPEARVNDGTLASLLYGLGANPLDISMRLVGSRPQEDGRFLVPVEVRIPLGKTTLIPRQELHQGQLRVAIAVIDEKGRLSTIEQTSVPITIPDQDIADARQQHFVYAAELLMRSGGQTVAVGVRDDFSGASSYVRQPVRVGS
jgi:VWFA-related protein